jgi:hypothetical protein
MQIQNQFKHCKTTSPEKPFRKSEEVLEMSDLRIPSEDVGQVEIKFVPIEGQGRLLLVAENPVAKFDGIVSRIKYVVRDDTVILIRSTSKDHRQFDLSVKEVEKSSPTQIRNAALEFAVEGLSLHPEEGDDNE